MLTCRVLHSQTANLSPSSDSMLLVFSTDSITISLDYFICSVLHSQAADLSPSSDSVLLVILGLSSLKSRVGAGPATELQQQLHGSLGGNTSGMV